MALAGAVCLASLPSPAVASSDTRTRVVRCGQESCLLVAGHRDDPAAIVRINGQAVPVAGRQDWRAIIPVATVREMSAPHARDIEVSLSDPATHRETSDIVDLPIGLLGNVTELAALEISIP